MFRSTRKVDNRNNCCLLYFNANIICSFTKSFPPTGAPPLDLAGDFCHPVFFYAPSPIILWDRRPCSHCCIALQTQTIQHFISCHRAQMSQPTTPDRQTDRRTNNSVTRSVSLRGMAYYNGNLKLRIHATNGCAIGCTTRSIWKNVGPIRHCEPPNALILHCHSPGVATVARRVRMMSTMKTTTRDRGDRYGPIEWAQLDVSCKRGFINVVDF